MIETLVPVIVGALISVVPGFLLARYNYKNKQLEELQTYRKLLMQQYMEYMNEFNQIIVKVIGHSLVIDINGNEGQSLNSTDLKEVLAHIEDIRLVVFKASSILRATGDAKLFVYGWALYQEALSNVDDSVLSFKTEDYNPIYYFRLGMDIGLVNFAHVISNNVPASRELPNLELSIAVTKEFRDILKKKYSEIPGWADRHKNK